MNLRPFALLAVCLVHAPFTLARNPEPTTAPVWEIKAGDTLTHVAISRYGCDAYAGFLTRFTQVDPKKLHVGKKLATPDFSVAMEKCGASSAAPRFAPLLGKFADEFGALDKMITESRKDSSALEKLRPLPQATLDKLTKVQGQATAVRSAVADSKLPKSLSKSLGNRLGKIDDLFKALIAFETNQSGPYYLTGTRSINRIHHQLDGALRELIDYACRPYE